MTVAKWHQIIIPVQAVLLLSQMVTGMRADHIPDRIFQLVHVGGGILLGLLVALHVVLNRNWVAKNYHRKREPVVNSTNRENGTAQRSG